MAEHGGSTFHDDIIERHGVRLRPLAEADLPDIVAACNDAVVQQWLPLPAPYREDHARWFALEHAPAARESGEGIERAIEVDGRLCGVIGLKFTNWQVRKSEIGYWLAPWGRGRGIMTRAVCALTDWALETQGMNRIEVLVATGNTASQAVVERAGFQREGLLRAAGHTHDGLVDMVASSRLASDPRPQPRTA